MRKSIFKTGLVWLWIAVVVLIIDRYTKMWVLHHLTLFVPHVILPVFNLTLSYNTGAAFGFLNKTGLWPNVFLGCFAVLVSIVAIIWLYQLNRKEWLPCVALSLIIGGALGNALDRALYGFVVDFLSFHIQEWHFAIFNGADTAICIGAFLLVVNWLFTRSH